MFWSKRDSVGPPSAYSIPGTRTWLNDDGAWSTFALDIGAGPAGSQAFSAVVSTSSLGIWLPNSIGCTLNSSRNSSVAAPLKPAICPPSRGIGLYNGLQSTGYDPKNSNSARLLGAATPSLFNPDYDPGVTPLYSDQFQAYSLRATYAPIFSVSGLSPLLATFGIGSGALQVGVNTSTSVLNVLNDADTIPSASWGYTAGAKYADRTASLVLGGYDAYRVSASSLDFDMSPNGTLDVIVDSILLNFNNGSDTKAAPAPARGFTATIDSTTPHLYLPNATINWLASSLHLSEYGRLLYYNKLQLEANATLANVASYSMTLRRPSDNKTIFLDFPLPAFTATLSWTYELNQTNILLFRRAGPSRNVVLGRAFFQEAYVIADFGRQSFQVSQTIPVPSTESIVAIQGAEYPNARSARLSMGAIVDTVIGSFAALLISAGLLWFLWLKPRREKARDAKFEPVTYEKAELDGAPADPKEPMSEPVYEAGSDFRGIELEPRREVLPPAELEGDPHPSALRSSRNKEFT